MGYDGRPESYVVAEVDNVERAERGGRRRRKICAREMTVAELADEVEVGEAEAAVGGWRSGAFSAGRWTTCAAGRPRWTADGRYGSAEKFQRRRGQKAGFKDDRGGCGDCGLWTVVLPWR